MWHYFITSTASNSYSHFIWTPTQVFVSPTDHVFLRFVPSLVAAACVASSRVILHLSPTWPPRLQCLTAYSWEQMLPCVERLLLWVWHTWCTGCLIKLVSITAERKSNISFPLLCLEWILCHFSAANENKQPKLNTCIVGLVSSKVRTHNSSMYFLSLLQCSRQWCEGSKQAEVPAVRRSICAGSVPRPGSERDLASVHAAAKLTVRPAELSAGDGVCSGPCHVSDAYSINAGVHGPSARPRAASDHFCTHGR